MCNLSLKKRKICLNTSAREFSRADFYIVCCNLIPMYSIYLSQKSMYNKNRSRENKKYYTDAGVVQW